MEEIINPKSSPEIDWTWDCELPQFVETSSEMEKIINLNPKSSPEIDCTWECKSGRRKVRNPAKPRTVQYSTFLELFEKEDYKLRIDLKAPTVECTDDSFYVDPNNMSDYDDDLVVVPDDVDDPVVYKLRRRIAVADDRSFVKYERWLDERWADQGVAINRG